MTASQRAAECYVPDMHMSGREQPGRAAQPLLIETLFHIGHAIALSDAAASRCVAYWRLAHRI
jgi:hypothetical protein